MNAVRITLVSFLTYFLLSAMLAPIGILTGPIAEHFGRPITEVTAQFGWLTGGNLVGALIALIIFDFFPLRWIFVFVYGAIAIALASLSVIETLESSRWVLGLTGIGSGIGLAGAAITISRTYEDDTRASMLVITDGCFSVAGFGFATLATYLIGLGLFWSTTYQMVALIAAVIFFLALTSSMPETRLDKSANAHLKPWPPSVWLCVASLFLYTLGQYSVLFWLPNYAETRLSAAPDMARGLVGQFWLGMFFAQVFVAWWVLKIGVNRLIMIAATSTLLCSLPLWLVQSTDMLTWLALFWGFANLSMLKAILSLATQMVPVASSRLVSLLLLGATTGTAISPFVTSQVVNWTDNRVILMFGSACYALLLVMMVTACSLTKVGPNRRVKKF